MKTGLDASFTDRHLISAILAVVLLISLAALDGGTGFAAVLDFSTYPDGTLVSAGNPYDAILTLQAHEGANLSYADPIQLKFVTLAMESSIRNGVLAVTVDPSSIPVPPPDAVTVNLFLSGQLTATFSQPVVGVSFLARFGSSVSYSYTGVDGNGVSFTGSGRGAETWSDYTLNIPEGGYLSGFNIAGGDINVTDASFYVNDITFTQVPEPSTLLFGAFTLVALAWRRLRSLRNR